MKMQDYQDYQSERKKIERRYNRGLMAAAILLSGIIGTGVYVTTKAKNFSPILEGIIGAGIGIATGFSGSAIKSKLLNKRLSKLEEEYYGIIFTNIDN